ncbi:MAG TPA: hypothetical protein VI935_07645 [Thermodesulfobacteriota bacterium]|nr:hypothetical protein [Thermodesulfobacteriota bacterium]
MDGKNLTPQNAPGSMIGNLGGVLLPPGMPFFTFIGQPPSYRVSAYKDIPFVIAMTAPLSVIPSD